MLSQQMVFVFRGSVSGGFELLARRSSLLLLAADANAFLRTRELIVSER